MPRLYRYAPLNSIWEGSGNVPCLEMLSGVKKEAGTLEMVLQEIRAARGGNKHFDSFADRLERELADSTQLEARARRLAELFALALFLLSKGETPDNILPASQSVCDRTSTIQQLSVDQ